MASSIEAIQKILQETVAPGFSDIRERLTRVEIEIKRLDDKIDSGLLRKDERMTHLSSMWTIFTRLQVCPTSPMSTRRKYGLRSALKTGACAACSVKEGTIGVSPTPEKSLENLEKRKYRSQIRRIPQRSPEGERQKPGLMRKKTRP